MVVNMVPSQITNLKSALKLINSHAMGAAAISEEDNMSKHEQVLSPASDKILHHLTSNSTVGG